MGSAGRAAVAVVLAVAAGVILPGQEPGRAQVPFEQWLKDLRQEALAKGISQPTVDSALRDVAVLPVVVERDRAQAEQVLPVETYLKNGALSSLASSSHNPTSTSIPARRNCSNPLPFA